MTLPESASPLFFLSGSIALGVVGQLCFKRAMNGEMTLFHCFTSPWLAVGLLLYGVSTVFYLLSLRSLPLSLAVPTLAFGYVLSAIIAVVLMGERLSMIQSFGISLTFIGVTLLHWKTNV